MSGFSDTDRPPPPTAQLTGCVWLPRILWKARHQLQGTLPKSFAESYCRAAGVDGHFLSFFDLTVEGIEALAQLDDDEAAERFLQIKGISPEKIQEWNRIATQLGRPGYPMADIFDRAIETTYKHVATPGRDTVFKILEADDALL